MKYHFTERELQKGLEPEQMGLEHISARTIECMGEQTIETGKEEVCFVVVKGSLRFQCESESGSSFEKDMIYVPRNKKISLSANKKSLVLRLGAPAHTDTNFEHISFQTVDEDPKKHVVVGRQENNSLRHVWNCIDDRFFASRLMVGICQGSFGGWTAWPPHEHAKKREEVYYYINMNKNFGIQCVYETLDKPICLALVQEGDLISIPKGFHPNVGCPAGSISYIYCMAAKQAGKRVFMDLRFQKEYGDRL